jgi:molybdate transport repressor ModE-like protein
MSMDLRLLQTFICVVQEGSLTGAGRQLFLCQSAVSRRISRLERLLGTPVLERDTGHCALTDTGTRLLPIATALLQQAALLEQLIVHSRIPSQPGSRQREQQEVGTAP